jgi:hypothetical protein
VLFKYIVLIVAKNPQLRENFRLAHQHMIKVLLDLATANGPSQQVGVPVQRLDPALTGSAVISPACAGIGPRHCSLFFMGTCTAAPGRVWLNLLRCSLEGPNAPQSSGGACAIFEF